MNHSIRNRWRLRAGMFAASILALGSIGCGGSTNVVPGQPSGNNNNGVLPQNVIFYMDVPGGDGTDVRYINPDGSGDTRVTTLSPSVQGFAVNPRTGQYVFGYQEPEGSTFGLYLNGSVSSSGATTLVGPSYDFISNVQISPDGQTVYYIAASGEGPTTLYQVPVGGGTPTAIDTAEAVSVSPAGNGIVYSKLTGEVAELYVRGDSTNNESVQLTHSGTEHFYPAWNRQGTRIAFASAAEDGSTDLFTIDASGGDLHQVTSTPGVAEISPSFNAAGDRLAFGEINFDVEQSGIYTISATGTETDRQLVKADPSILDWTYWTTPSGRSRALNVVQAIRARRR